MSNRKREVCSYLLFDYRGVEAHLMKMAARGWRLEKVGTYFWTYRRAEPARVTYAVTYLPDASQFDPDPSEQQASLAELCAAAGWTYVTNWSQMQIFVNERPDPVPLETDESVRLEVIRRSMKKSFQPWGIAALVLAAVMAILQIKTLVTDPIHLLSSNSGLTTSVLWDALVVLQAGNLLSYRRWCRRSAESVARGGPCADTGPGLRRLNRVVLWLAILCLALFFVSSAASADGGTVLFLLCYLALFVLLVYLVNRFRRYLQRQGVSRRRNLALTLAVDLVLAVVLVGGLTGGYLALSLNGTFSGRETYTYDGREWDADPEPLPLTLEDLTGESYAHIRRGRYGSGSFLVREDNCHENVLDGQGDWKFLDYTVTAAALPALGDLAAEHVLKEWTDRGYHDYAETDPAPWGAEAAYRLIYDDGWDRYATDDYLLCWPDRVVEISLTDVDLTPEVMAAVGEKLGSA